MDTDKDYQTYGYKIMKIVVKHEGRLKKTFGWTYRGGSSKDIKKMYYILSILSQEQNYMKTTFLTWVKFVLGSILTLDAIENGT